MMMPDGVIVLLIDVTTPAPASTNKVVAHINAGQRELLAGPSFDILDVAVIGFP